MGKDKQETYQIYVRGEVDEQWTDWFSNLAVTSAGPAESLLTLVVPDQAALRGVLDRLWDLNYEVIAVSSAGHRPEETVATREKDDATPRYPTRIV
jgi:hypothetical protein